jgi:hypothetical protein
MLKVLKKDMEKFKEMLREQNGNTNREIENLKRNWKEILDLKSVLAEIKNSLGRFKNKFEQAEESVNLKRGQ